MLHMGERRVTLDLSEGGQGKLTSGEPPEGTKPDVTLTLSEVSYQAAELCRSPVPCARGGCQVAGRRTNTRVGRSLAPVCSFPQATFLQLVAGKLQPQSVSGGRCAREPRTMLSASAARTPCPDSPSPPALIRVALRRPSLRAS